MESIVHIIYMLKKEECCMSHNKWGILCLFTTSMVIISGGISILFSITSVLSLNKFFRASKVNME